MMRLLLRCVMLLAAPVAALAQSSTHSTITTRVAIVRDATVCACDMNGVPAPKARDLVIAAVGRAWPLASGAGGRVQLFYTPELLPAIFSSRTADERLAVWKCGNRRYCGTSQAEDVWSITSVGVGLLPIGAVLEVGITDALRTRARIGAGAIRMTRPIPLSQGRKFNFLAEGSLGVAVRVTPHVSVTAGALLNHISNGGTAEVNLGMDSRMLELGLAIGR